MTAWEAMTVAAVDSTTIGICAQPGTSMKNGALTTFRSPNSSAPWPK